MTIDYRKQTTAATDWGDLCNCRFLWHLQVISCSCSTKTFDASSLVFNDIELGSTWLYCMALAHLTCGTCGLSRLPWTVPIGFCSQGAYNSFSRLHWNSWWSHRLHRHHLLPAPLFPIRKSCLSYGSRSWGQIVNHHKWPVQSKKNLQSGVCGLHLRQLSRTTAWGLQSAVGYSQTKTHTHNTWLTHQVLDLSFCTWRCPWSPVFCLSSCSASSLRSPRLSTLGLLLCELAGVDLTTYKWAATIKLSKHTEENEITYIIYTSYNNTIQYNNTTQYNTIQ